MTRILERSMILRVEVEEGADGKVYVVLASRLQITHYVVKAVLGSVFTCGVAALIFGLLLYLKHKRWNTATNTALNLLKADLA